ncbi:MAG: GNAT family N-acetyltransferase [bacterium]|nr:GNAT family N-acetyltransferase [bacterium]
MKHFKKLVGAKCYLSPMNPDEAEQYTEWVNDMEVSLYMQWFPLIISLPAEKEILEMMSKEGTSFAIVDLKTDELIGNCGLLNKDPVNRTAEAGIFIGAKDFRGRGYGEEAMRLLLDYSFNIINMNNIMLFTYSFNKPALKCYEKCGFKVIGTRRKARILGARKYDIVYMDMLAEEFTGSILDKFL